MLELLKDLIRLLLWIIPIVLKLFLGLAVVMLAIGLFPIWLAFGLPGLRDVQGLALLYALWPRYGTPQPRKQKPPRDHMDFTARGISDESRSSWSFSSTPWFLT